MLSTTAAAGNKPAPSSTPAPAAAAALPVPPPPVLLHCRRASRRLEFIRALLSLQGVKILTAALNSYPAASHAASTAAAAAAALGGGGEGGAPLHLPVHQQPAIGTTTHVPHGALLLSICTTAAALLGHLCADTAAVRAVGGWASWLEVDAGGGTPGV